MIATIRTGTLTHKQQEQLDQLGVKELFTIRRRVTCSKTAAIEVYNNMKKILPSDERDHSEGRAWGKDILSPFFRET